MACCFITPAQARVFFVTNTADTTNVTSLRGAILAANHRGGNNTIFLGEPFRSRRTNTWVYPLTIPGENEVGGLTGDLNVLNKTKLTIASLFPNVTIDASGLGDRIFWVLSGGQLTLVNLKLTGGLTAHGNYGGAIRNDGTLFLRSCIITSNFCSAGTIGGIFGGHGGGLYNQYSSSVFSATDCQFTKNSAGPGSIGGYGGAIYNNGTSVLSRCTISENQSGLGMGGILTSGISGGFGGGIYNYFTGKMTINNCILNLNVCGDGADGTIAPTGVDGGWVAQSVIMAR